MDQSKNKGNEKFRRVAASYSVIAQVGFNCLLAFFLLNVGAYVVERIHPEPGLGPDFDYAPYRMMKHVHAPWPLNEDGFRAPSLKATAATASEHFNIVFLGGSVCLGVGGDNGAPLPDLLEEALHHQGLKQARVLNLCQGGAVTGQELAILLQYGLEQRPSLVVSFDGANDLMHPAPIGFDEKPNLPYLNKEMSALWSQVKNGSSFILPLMQTPIAHLVRRTIKHIHFHPAAEAVNSADEIVDSYIQGLDLATRISTSYHIAHAVVLQPVLYRGKKLHPQELAKVADIYQDPGRVSVRANLIYALAVEKLRHWSKTSGATFYDATQTFKDVDGPIYVDSVHYGVPQGYQLVLATLKQQGFLTYVEQLYRKWEKR